MSDKVAALVISAIAKRKKIPAENITLDMTLEELRIDSLDGLDLFFDLEEALDVTIPDIQARSLTTVRQVVEGLDRLLADKAAVNSTSPDSPSESAGE